MRPTLPVCHCLSAIAFLAVQLFLPGLVNSQEQAAAEVKPNVLLIAIDDLNDWTSCLRGHPQARTPHMDRLADQGTLFANAHCQSPVCNPSRASLMTGRYPHSTGLYFLGPHWKEVSALRDVATLPERFAAEGYDIMGVGKLFHRGPGPFAEVGRGGGTLGGVGPRPEKKISQPHGHPLWDWGAYPENDEDMPDYKIASWASARLKEARDQPFLLGVGFYRPHVPMYVPRPWFEMHPLEQVQRPLVLEHDRVDLPLYARDLTTLQHVAPTHEWMLESGECNHAVQAYLASTTFVDAQVGRVLDALDRSRYRDNTIVVLFSDHGFHLGEKARWAKRTLWDDGTRVPLIIAAPSKRGSQLTRKPAQLIDIFPTLLELCGLDQDPGQEGRSLVPLLDDPDLPSWPHAALTSFGPGNHGIRTEDFRYIRYRDGSEELYDHRTDPHEWHNLASEPKWLSVIERHREFLPAKDHPLVDGKSTGHNAFAAAEAAWSARSSNNGTTDAARE